MSRCSGLSQSKNYGKRPKNIMVWENGDFYGDGYSIIISPQYFRTWNGILAFITDTIKPSFGAVRNLFNLESKQVVNSFESLDPNAKYIAVGNEKLKQVQNGYKTPAEKQDVYQPRKYYSENFYTQASMASTSGTITRARKTILFVMSNGKVHEMPCKVVLTESDLNSWETALDYIARSLDIPEGISFLYTVFGDAIINPRDIQNGCIYVAVPTNEKFVNLDYISIFRSLLPTREIDFKRVDLSADPPFISDPWRASLITVEVVKKKSQNLSNQPRNKKLYCGSPTRKPLTDIMPVDFRAERSINMSIKKPLEYEQSKQINIVNAPCGTADKKCSVNIVNNQCYVKSKPKRYCYNRIVPDGKRSLRKDEGVEGFIKSILMDILEKVFLGISQAKQGVSEAKNVHSTITKTILEYNNPNNYAEETSVYISPNIPSPKHVKEVQDKKQEVITRVTLTGSIDTGSCDLEVDDNTLVPLPLIDEPKILPEAQPSKTPTNVPNQKLPILNNNYLPYSKTQHLEIPTDNQNQKFVICPKKNLSNARKKQIYCSDKPVVDESQTSTGPCAFKLSKPKIIPDASSKISQKPPVVSSDVKTPSKIESITPKHIKHTPDDTRRDSNDSKKVRIDAEYKTTEKEDKKDPILPKSTDKNRKLVIQSPRSFIDDIINSSKIIIERSVLEEEQKKILAKKRQRGGTVPINVNQVKKVSYDLTSELLDDSKQKKLSDVKEDETSDNSMIYFSGVRIPSIVENSPYFIESTTIQKYLISEKKKQCCCHQNILPTSLYRPSLSNLLKKREVRSPSKENSKHLTSKSSTHKESSSKKINRSFNESHMPENATEIQSDSKTYDKIPKNNYVTSKDEISGRPSNNSFHILNESNQEPLDLSKTGLGSYPKSPTSKDQYPTENKKGSHTGQIELSESSKVLSRLTSEYSLTSPDDDAHLNSFLIEVKKSQLNPQFSSTQNVPSEKDLASKLNNYVDTSINQPEKHSSEPSKKDHHKQKLQSCLSKAKFEEHNSPNFQNSLPAVDSYRSHQRFDESDKVDNDKVERNTFVHDRAKLRGEVDVEKANCSLCCNPLPVHKPKSHIRAQHSRIIDIPEVHEFARESTVEYDYEKQENDKERISEQIANIPGIREFNGNRELPDPSTVTVLRVRGARKQDKSMISPSVNVLSPSTNIIMSDSESGSSDGSKDKFTQSELTVLNVRGSNENRDYHHEKIISPSLMVHAPSAISEETEDSENFNSKSERTQKDKLTQSELTVSQIHESIENPDPPDKKISPSLMVHNASAMLQNPLNSKPKTKKKDKLTQSEVTISIVRESIGTSDDHPDKKISSSLMVHNASAKSENSEDLKVETKTKDKRAICYCEEKSCQCKFNCFMRFKNLAIKTTESNLLKSESSQQGSLKTKRDAGPQILLNVNGSKLENVEKPRTSRQSTSSTAKDVESQTLIKSGISQQGLLGTAKNAESQTLIKSKTSQEGTSRTEKDAVSQTSLNVNSSSTKTDSKSQTLVKSDSTSQQSSLGTAKDAESQTLIKSETSQQGTLKTEKDAESQTILSVNSSKSDNSENSRSSQLDLLSTKTDSESQTLVNPRSHAGSKTDG